MNLAAPGIQLDGLLQMLESLFGVASPERQVAQQIVSFRKRAVQLQGSLQQRDGSSLGG